MVPALVIRLPVLLLFPPRIHLLGTHHSIVEQRCQIWLPLAVVGKNEPLVKAESHTTILARVVMDVVVPVVEHKA